jgi:hypothetical protein
MPWNVQHFAKVPLGIVHIGLTPTEREIFRVLCYRCWRNREDALGYTVVTAEQLAREAGVSRKAAIKALAMLRRFLVDRVQLGPAEYAYAVREVPANVVDLSEALSKPVDLLRTKIGRERLFEALERRDRREADHADRRPRGSEAPSGALQ